jgi:hypothetical protein
VIHTYNTNAIFKRLKSAHSEIWQELGSPKWQIHFGDDAYQNSMKYIRKHGFEDLEDDVLEAHYRAIKRAEKVSLLLALFVIAITVYEVLKSSI